MVIHQTLNAINVANRKIGPGYPCMIIAEAGVNHNGSLSLAKKLIDAASSAGADVVKFQNYKTELLIQTKLYLEKHEYLF